MASPKRPRKHLVRQVILRRILTHDASADPYHTYLSLACLAVYSPLPEGTDDADADSWKLERLDPLLNAKLSTAAWARKHIPAPAQ